MSTAKILSFMNKYIAAKRKAQFGMTQLFEMFLEIIHFHPGLASALHRLIKFDPKARIFCFR